MPVHEKQLRFGAFELDAQCGQLRKDGIGLKLQGQPVQILEILLEKPGELVTREELRQRLWSTDTFVDFDHSLNAAMQRLRQTLGDDAGTPIYIETIPKRGYRFIGKISHEETKTPATPGVDETVEKVAATFADTTISASQKSRSLRFWRIASASAFVLLWLGAAAYWLLKPPPIPRIVASHVLTKMGTDTFFTQRDPGYFGGPNFLTDRGSIYFQAETPSGLVTLQVSTAGGESMGSLKVNGYLGDISRDGSELLFITRERNTCDVWEQSLPGGTPRLVILNACSPRWSVDGRNIFFIRNNATELYRANADGTGVKRLATVPRIVNPHLSPDGSRIRFVGRGYWLWEVGADGSNPHPILSTFQDVFGGSWTADGKYYFFTSWDGDRSSLWAVYEAHRWWKKASTSVPQQLTFGPMSILAPGISKDGKQLYAVGIERRGELSAYDSKAGKFTAYLGGESICFVDFSRDGQWMAYVTYPEGTLWRSRIDGSERRQLTVPPMAVANPRWSPDGKLIAFADMSNGDRRRMTYVDSQRIYAVSADGGGPMLLLAGNFGDPTWSPDGKSIAYHYFTYPAAEVRILDLQSQKSTTVPGSQGFWSPRWSPDGKYLVALGGDRPRNSKLMLFSFENNNWKELASCTDCNWPSWSHDNKYIYVQDAVSLVRIGISKRNRERIASLLRFHATSYYWDRIGFWWFGLTPDDRPLTTRDTGIQELYAFDLEYK